MIQSFIYSVSSTLKIIIGNKIDLIQLNENFRRISKERASEFAKKLNIKHFDECSAKDNFNIAATFDRLYKGKINCFNVKDVYIVQKDKLEEKTIEKTKFLDSKKPNPKSQCC